MITLKRFRRIENAVRQAGYSYIIDWSEAVTAPENADEFASEAIYVIINGGMKQSVAAPIHKRCMAALHVGQSSTTVFGHPGKAPAIDEIWQARHELFAGYQMADDKLTFCDNLPWVGPVTKHHLAKNYGVDTAKPDIHLERLAQFEKTTTEKLCRRLARQSGYRVATVDSILWRACESGILRSRVYEQEGWRKAFQKKPGN